MNSDLLTGLNEHLKLEFRASHEYLAMSIWLAEHDLPGFAKWMRQQSSDELMHAQRIIDHLVERDQKVVLPAVDAPPTGWTGAEALCDHVLKNEQEVTASINNLYAMAEKTKDRPAVVMLQWFVTEQMEEEAAARAVLGRIRLAGGSGVGMLMIDQELATAASPECRSKRPGRRRLAARKLSTRGARPMHHAKSSAADRHSARHHRRQRCARSSGRPFAGRRVPAWPPTRSRPRRGTSARPPTLRGARRFPGLATPARSSGAIASF